MVENAVSKMLLQKGKSDTWQGIFEKGVRFLTRGCLFFAYMRGIGGRDFNFLKNCAL